MAKAFNKAVFEKAFSDALKKITSAEKVTKEELKTLSRSTLEALHTEGGTHGDIGYINRLIAVLSPLNKANAILFYKDFAGFSFDDNLMQFTGKDKKKYHHCLAAYKIFMEDPNNNLWSWAAKELKPPEKKAFTLEAVTEGIKGYLKKANASGINQTEVMRAILKGGITSESILAIMGDIGYDIGDIAEEPALFNKVGPALL